MMRMLPGRRLKTARLRRLVVGLTVLGVVMAVVVPIVSAATPVAPGATANGAPGGGEAPASRLKALVSDPTEALHDGVFRSTCAFSHTAMDDPIVKPGQPGASHSHEFFGNRTTNAGSTYETLLGQATSCLISGDTAAYWVPSLLQNGVRVAPRVLKAYSRSAGPLGGVSPFPAGLKVVAGNSHATSAQSLSVTGWQCAGPTPGPASTVPVACPGADTILVVRFPNCWDGLNLDSADHASHLAYGLNGRCPATHPVRLPMLAMQIHYRLTSTAGLAFASGSIYSAHADFFNAWDPAVLAALVAANLN